MWDFIQKSADQMTDKEIEEWWNKVKDKPNHVTWDYINESFMANNARDFLGRQGKKIIVKDGETY